MNWIDRYKSAINQIPECMAAGYVDVATGLPLSVKAVDDAEPGSQLDVGIGVNDFLRDSWTGS